MADVDDHWPVSFDARYGGGLERTVCLGGGGLYFIAWQVGYLQTLTQGGVGLARAERVVGTSAGAVVATSLTAGRIGRLHGQVSALSRFPGLLRVLAPSGALRPSQQRALDSFVQSTDARRETVQAIGRNALAAVTPDPVRLRANLQMVLQTTTWPSAVLHVTCVDAFSGDRCVITQQSGIRPSRAAAASSAVPGLFPPQPIGDRKCMDGGVSGSGLHLDVIAGSRRALVLSLRDGLTAVEAGMTERAGAIEDELDALEHSGTRIFLRSPAAIDRKTLMSPASVPGALLNGAEQAEADLPAFRAFWDS